MQRQLTADRPTTLRAPVAPRAQQRELDQALAWMIEQMAQRWRNQVFGALDKTTIEKFEDTGLRFAYATLHREFIDSPCCSEHTVERWRRGGFVDEALPDSETRQVVAVEINDAQTGNYARVYMKLANQVRRKLLRQFDDQRIEALVKRIAGKVDNHNRRVLYGMVEKRIGLSTTELTRTEGLTYDINALIIETEQWVKKLRDDTLELYTANSLRAMALGESLETVMEQFDELVEKRRNHARFTARNQIANFNSLCTKIRAQNLGLTKAKWRTSSDERVRPSHQWRNGRVFELSKGLYSPLDQQYLLPGTDYQCRCDYELLVPSDDEVS